METNLTTAVTQIVLAFVFFGGFLFITLGSISWTMRDAQKRGQSGGTTLLLLWLFGPFSALLWLMIRPRTTMAERPTTIYTTADDALESASKLDQLGEWDAAIALYETISQKWPDNSDYVSQCMKQIRQKQSVSR
jgi:hypothetical protein